MTAAEERLYVLNTFQESMTPYKNKKIALYGLGVNSEYLIENQQGYQITSLLDAKRMGEICFGLPVISAEEAMQQVDVIVIVAKTESVPIIYNRIAWMEDGGMIITDIAGRRIVDKTDEEIEKELYWQKNYLSLIAAIEQYEVITFDIFDTLLMRTVLKPRDIFEIMGKICYEKYPKLFDSAVKFTMLREEAEEEAKRRFNAFNYKQIYEIIQEYGDFTSEQIKELMELEVETEKKFLIPRDDMVQALEFAYKSGKKVYLISDMYFSGEEIKIFLDTCGIVHYHGLLVSSDAGCWKWPEAELFKKAIDSFKLTGKKVLHIGDNEGADWICGKKAGFDIYPIWSAYHLLEKSALKYLLVNVKTVEDSCMLGIYAAKYLNSPFALHEGKGILILKNEHDVGFAGYGALLTAYTHYLIKKYKNEDKVKILFLARDGYLIRQLYEQIVQEKNITDVPEGIYVLSSRRSLSIPAIYQAEDLEEQIKRIDNEAIGGEFLKKRFGVRPNISDMDAEKVMRGEVLRNYLRKYETEILKNAEKERKEYLCYLTSLGIESEKEKHILMDSATSGTSAYYWRKFVQPDARMEAILLVDISNWSVYSDTFDRGFLGKDSKLLKRKAYCRSEYLNDSILTSPDSQFLYMEGEVPVFSEEEGQRAWNCVAQAQKGIKDFCKEYMDKISYSVMMQEFSKDFLDDFIHVLTEKCKVSEQVKNKFMVVEQFSGKMGEIQAWNTLH